MRKRNINKAIQVSEIYKAFMKIYGTTGAKIFNDMTCSEKQLTNMRNTIAIMQFGIASEIELAKQIEYYINNIQKEELKKKGLYDILILLSQRCFILDNREDGGEIKKCIERINEYYDFTGDINKFTS